MAGDARDESAVHGTTAYSLLQQQLFTTRARLDRQVSQLTRLMNLSNDLLHRPGERSVTETFAEAIVDVLDLAVGAVWLLPPDGDDTAEPFAVFGVTPAAGAWDGAGGALAARLVLDGAVGAVPLDAALCALLPGAELVDPVVCRCVARDGSTAAVVLAGNTNAAAGLFEPVSDDTSAMLAVLAEKLAAHLDNGADRRLIERQVDELRESEERLALVLAGTNDGWWDWDLGTGQCFLSGRLLEMLGRPSAEAETGHFWADLVHPSDRPAFDSGLARAIAEGVPKLEAEVRLRRLDGEGYLPVLVRGTISTAADGAVDRFAGSIQDLSERKRHETEHRRVETKLRETAKLEALGVLAGGIAHDFNNLLAAIMGHIELARSTPGADASVRSDLEAAMVAANRAADLARQMLAYSGRGRLTVGPVHLEAMLREMGDLLGSSVGKGAVLRYAFEPGLPPVLADPTQLRQVALNLIVNASDALDGAPGTITLRTGWATLSPEDPAVIGGIDATVGTYVMLEVADTGSGMDRDTLARIFDPFYSTKSIGRGLGLAATLGTIKGHGGAIRVWSEPGAGTRFQVLLPGTADVTAARRPGSSPPARDGHVGRVLVVDDEPHVRRVGRRLLERAGFEVLEAADGPEAVERFRRDPEGIDVVLLDLTLPSGDGIAVMGELRAIRDGVPVVISSGWSVHEVSERLSALPRTSFLQKPYTAEAMAHAVARARDGGL